jgi:hypothetical protein
MRAFLDRARISSYFKGKEGYARPAHAEAIRA